MGGCGGGMERAADSWRDSLDELASALCPPPSKVPASPFLLQRQLGLCENFPYVKRSDSCTLIDQRLNTGSWWTFSNTWTWHLTTGARVFERTCPANLLVRVCCVSRLCSVESSPHNSQNFVLLSWTLQPFCHRMIQQVSYPVMLALRITQLQKLFV